MDFSVLLKDLRDVAEKYQGKSTEPQVSTHAYVDMFTKILKKALKVTEQYDDQITVLWVALNQLAAIYKDLTAGVARDQLCKFIFGLCAKTVLNIQWAQLDEDSKVKCNFSTTVEDVHKILSQLGFFKFQLILDLMESHWTHPVLSKIMSGEEEDTEDCLEYIQKEDPDILKLRIEIMMKENCEEFALNLCDWSLKHPALQNDLKIKEHQIFILYKQQEYGKMQEVCETIICHDGIKVMSHLAKTPSNQELCIRLAQVFLIQDWVKPERTCCTQELLKLWIHHQYLADKDEERFLDSIWTVAKVCRDTEQIGVLIDGVKKECGDMFIQLYSELCKFAINIDKGNMEREEVQKDPEEYGTRRLAMSKTCVRMAFMLKEYDFRISRICGLTAFALDPTMDNLNLVNKLYWTMKNVSAASQNSKINIATLYEIERLLGQMRPDSLNPEYSWKQLIPVCKKYKLDYENDKSSIPLKIAGKKERTASQSLEENTVTPMPHMLEIVKSDKEVTKKIDTGQKKGKKPKNVVPKDIQKAHLAKMLGQKNLSREEIEKVLSNEFPRNVKQDFNDAPSLDVKELDRTINDLKKSIYLETQYREKIKSNLSSLQKCKKSKFEPGDNKKQHLSRQELFRQQQQMIRQKEPCYQRQQSAPAGSQSHGPILQRQLLMGSPQPPNAHSHHRQQQMSPPFGGSPPPAHSTSPRMSSPIGFSSSLSPPGFRQHSVSPNILSNRKSGSYSQINTSQKHSNIPQQLCNKIKAELQQQSRQNKMVKISDFNVLRPPGNSQQECAKIAQQIAEMHERQRAEKLQTARLQGQIDGVKVALNSRNIPSRSQISDLLSMTFQGSKGQNSLDGQKNPNLHGADSNHGKNYLKKKLERSGSVSSTQNFTSSEIIGKASLPKQNTDLSNVRNSTYSSPSQSAAPSSIPSISNRSQSAGRISNENHSSSSKVDSSMLVPGEQGWDPSRGIMKQKYYYKHAMSKDSVPKNSSRDTPLAMKPVYSMIVPKELTNPNRKDELVKTVTDMMKRFPKGMNTQQKGLSSSVQSPECSSTVVKVQTQTSKMSDTNVVTSEQHAQNKTSPPKLIPTSSLSSVGSNSNTSNNHSSFQPPVISVNSKTIGQNFMEEGLLNLNTLAAASMSVLGQDTTQQPVIGSLQLTQSIQQQPIQQQPPMFSNPVIESQPMFSPIQPVQVSVQQVVQQPEAILATPLYTMPNPVMPEHVLTQQLAGIQPQVDIALQQPVVQQIIAVQNQPIAMNHTQSFVNVVSQQPSFQVPTVGQATYSDVTQSLTGAQPITGGMSPSITVGIPQQIPGGIASTVMNGIPQSLTVPSEIIPPVNSNAEPQTSSSEGSVNPKQFLAPPELSPALVQQILSSLKKGGSLISNQIQSKGKDEKRAFNKGQKQRSAMVSKSNTSVSEIAKDSVKSVNEARQKILELRKQFEQTTKPGTSLSELSSVLPNREVPTSMLNNVANERQSSGILERLMADDKEVKVNPEIQNSNFPSTSNSRKGVVSQIPVSQQTLPELVDLGAKEFQLDSILALDNDNNINTENTVPNKPIVPVKSNEPARSHIPSSTVSGGGHEFKNVQENGSHANDVQQVVPPVVNTNICIDNKQNVQDEKPQELTYPSPSQSTYFNANRLGKERENREVKSMPVNTEELQKVCVNCDLQFPTEQLLIDHKKVSHCEPKWKCVYCKMSFKCAEILKSHEKNYCLKAPSTMVRCYICGVYFQSHEQLKAHLNPKTCTPQNMSKEKSQSEEDIVCGICKRKFETMTLIKEHVKIGCLKKDNNTYSKFAKSGDFDFSVAFKCTKCNFMNLNENIVSKHVEKCKEKNSSAKLIEIYACNMCDETFCVREDACRHVKRQCSKLKLTNTQKQVQDVYQKIKDANTSKESPVKARKIADQRINRQGAKEKPLNDDKEKQAKHNDSTELPKVESNEHHEECGKSSIDMEQQQKTNIEDLKPKTNVSKISIEKGTNGTIKVTSHETNKGQITPAQSFEKLKAEVKAPQHKAVDLMMKTVVSDSEYEAAELKVEMQKVQRITAENRFLAEFNEIEKRKKAIRMKKQRELERQQEILIKKERDKEYEFMRQKKLQHKMEEEKLRKLNERQGKEKNSFETEKEQFINSIIGTSTLQQKMKECNEKEKKGKKHYEIDKDEAVLNIVKNERKGLKQEDSCSIYRPKVEPNCKMKNENAVDETGSIENYQEDKEKNVTRNVMNKKRKRNQIADIDDNIKLPHEKRVLRDHIEESERKTRHNLVEKSETTKQSHRILKKNQLSPQDIRKLRGLRAKRLIKKKKYFIDEMEPIQREKMKKEIVKEDECQNMIQRIKLNHLHGKSQTEVKGQEIETVQKEESKRDCEKDRNRGNRNDDASMYIIDITDKDYKNKIKEERSVDYWRKVCRYCGFFNKGISISSHYIQTHKLGFRQMSYNYYCNFCNMQFPVTQTVQVKEHVFNHHMEALLGRIARGKYDKKIEFSSINNKSVSLAKTKCVSQGIGNSSKRRKHIRALELRKKCAEKLREITLVRKNTIIDISDLEDESQASCCSNHSTDIETPFKEANIEKTGRKGRNASDEVKDGRRIAPRLARQMVKSTVGRSKRINYFEELRKTSDIDDSSDTQVMTRSRSSSVSSSRSSLIASAKKRKSAITIATRMSLKSRQKTHGSLLLTRSGRAVKRPEIDYDKLTESSSLGSGEDNSELEDTDIRKRKSTRIRRLSEKGKSLRGTTSDTDESSTEEITRRVTRRSSSKGQNDGNCSDSLNNDEDSQVIENKRPRTGQSPARKFNSESAVELRSVKNKGKGRDRVGKAERVITRQISKNEEESDSETESNYTDIEHVVKMLDDRMVRNAAIGSAESDSESTSADVDILKRKYRLRKRHTDKKYRETESSDEEGSDQKEYDEDEGDNVSGLGQSGDDVTVTEDSQQPNIISKNERVEERPKVVLIGAEEDDDLNVDYGQLEEKLGCLNSQVCTANSPSQDDEFFKPDDNVKNKINRNDGKSPNVRTVLIDPEDEFAGLEASPEKSQEREKSVESEIISENVSEVDTEASTLPASVMDVDEFEFLKSDQTIAVKTNESNLNSSSNSSHKGAYGTEFIRYTETEKHEFSSDSEVDISGNTKDKHSNIDKDLVKTVDIEIPPLAEDVPVLPPRDFVSDRKRLMKDSRTKELISEKKTVQSRKTNVSPLLKSARVIIEDISVVKKALEMDSVEKKLIHECEASNCLVRIGRLSKEQIEKHTPNSRKTVKEKKECDVILIDDNNVESIIKNPKEGIAICNDFDQKPDHNKMQAKENQADNVKAVKLEDQQYETLIQDIVLDGDFIDQLLVNESITLNIQTPEQITEGNDCTSFQGAECLQVIVEDSNTTHNSAVLVVDVKSDKNAESQSNDEGLASNVFTVIAKSQVDTSNDLDESTNHVEPEEDVWIENAESYAENRNKSENSKCTDYEQTVVQVKTEETENIPDKPMLPDMQKEENAELSKLSTDGNESSAGETLDKKDEITMASSNGEKQHLALDKCKHAEYLDEKCDEVTEGVISTSDNDLNQDITLDGDKVKQTTTRSENGSLKQDQDISSTGTKQTECNISSKVEEMRGVEENKPTNAQDQNHISSFLSNEPFLCNKTLDESEKETARMIELEKDLEEDNGLNEHNDEEKEKTTEDQRSQFYDAVESKLDVEMMNQEKEHVIGIKDKTLIHSYDSNKDEDKSYEIIHADVEENVEQLSKEAEEKVEQLSKEAEEKVEQLNKEAEEKVEQLSKDVEEKVEQLGKEAEQKVEQLGKEAEEKVKQLSKEAGEKVEQLSKEAEEKEEQLNKEAEEKEEQLSKEAEETVEQLSKEAGEKVEQLSEEAEEKEEQLSKEAEEKVEQLSKDVEEGEQLSNKAEEKVEQLSKEAEEKVGQLSNEGEEKVEQLSKEAEEKVGQLNKEAEEKIEQVSNEVEEKVEQLNKEAEEKVEQLSKEAEEKVEQLSKEAGPDLKIEYSSEICDVLPVIETSKETENNEHAETTVFSPAPSQVDELPNTTEQLVKPLLDTSVENTKSELDMSYQTSSVLIKENIEELPAFKIDNDMDIEDDSSSLDDIGTESREQMEETHNCASNINDSIIIETPENIYTDIENESVNQTTQQSYVVSSEQNNIKVILSELCDMVARIIDTPESIKNDTTSIVENLDGTSSPSAETVLIKEVLQESSTHSPINIKDVANILETSEEKDGKQDMLTDNNSKSEDNSLLNSPDSEISQDATQKSTLDIASEEVERNENANENISLSNSSLLALQTYSDSDSEEISDKGFEISKQNSDTIDKSEEICEVNKINIIDRSEEVLIVDKQKMENICLHEVQKMEIDKSNETALLQGLDNSSCNITKTDVPVEIGIDGDNIDDNSSTDDSKYTEESNEEIALDNQSPASEEHNFPKIDTLQTERICSSVQTSNVNVHSLVSTANETSKEEVVSLLEVSQSLTEADLQRDLVKDEIENSLTNQDIASVEEPGENDIEGTVDANSVNSSKTEEAEAFLQRDLIKNEIESNLINQEIASVEEPVENDIEPTVDTNCPKTDELQISDINVNTVTFEEEKLSCVNVIYENFKKNPETELDTETERNTVEINIIQPNEEEKKPFIPVEEVSEMCNENVIEITDSSSKQTVKSEDNFKGLCTLNDDETTETVLDTLETSEAYPSEDELSDITYIDVSEEVEHEKSKEQVNETHEVERTTSEQDSSVDEHQLEVLSDSLLQAKESILETGVNCSKVEKDDTENDKTISQDMVQIGMQNFQATNVHTDLMEENINAVVREVVDSMNEKLEQNLIQGTEIRDTLANLDVFHDTSDDDNSVEGDRKNPKARIHRQASVSSCSDISLISFPEYTLEQKELYEGINDNTESVDDTITNENTEYVIKETEESQENCSTQNQTDSNIQMSQEFTVDLPVAEQCNTPFLERSDYDIHKNTIKEQLKDNTEKLRERYINVNDDQQYDSNTYNADNINLDKVEVYEEIHEDESDILKNVSEETIEKPETSNFGLCKDASFEICLDDQGLIQDTQLEETVIEQSGDISDHDGQGSDKNIETYSKIENEKQTEVVSELSNSNKPEVKSDDQDDMEEIKQTENAQEVVHTQEGNYTHQDVHQFENNENQYLREEQKTDFLKGVEEKSCEKFISSESVSETLHLEQNQKPNKGYVEIVNCVDDEKNIVNDNKKEVDTLLVIEDERTEEISNQIEEAASALGIEDKDISLSKTNIDIKTQITKNAERTNSSSTDEEDPTLDKWVKEILNQEAEEKKEVFELPSPRRKGMIVGATCVHKKPTFPFVETRTFKREESPGKDTNVVAKTGAKKPHEEKNEKSNTEISEVRTLTQNDVKTVQTEDIESSKDRKQICSERQSAGSLQNVQVGTEKIESKAAVMKKATKDKGRASTPSSKDDQRSGKDKHLLRSGSTQPLNTKSEVQGKATKTRKSDDKSKNQKNVKEKPLEVKSVDKEFIGNKEQKINKSSQNLTNKKNINLNTKSNEKKIPEQDNQFEEIQRADETDEEFRRRTEAVRSARRKSSVKPYESDFNFEDNGKNLTETDSKVTPTTSFWPSDSENTLENFDTASLYSSSSGSSGNTGGFKDGKLKVMERCARDFGKDEVAKPRIHQQVSRTNVMPVLTCPLPEKTTISALAVQIVNSMGKNITKPVSSTVKCANPVLSTKIKVIDKNTLSNISLSGRIVEIVKSSPPLEKSVSITHSNIQKLTSQLNIGKEGSVDKGNKDLLVKTRKVKGERFEDKNVASIKHTDHNDETSIDNDFEPSEENLSNKGKALRALHRNDKPFKWENTPSPPKILRSQTNKVDCKTDSESVEPRSKPETRQAKEKLLKVTPTSSASLKNLRENKKKMCDKSSVKASNKQDKISEKMSNLTELRKTRQKDKDSDRDIPNKRGTKSRSGSKDKLKVDKQKPDMAVKSKKQKAAKSEHNAAGCKNSVNNLKTVNKSTSPKNEMATTKPRHMSGDNINAKDKDQTKVKAAAVDTNENKEIKTRKRKSEVDKMQEAETESNDEPVVDVIKMSPEEPVTKVCKLDGTANSPEKNEVSVCGHKLTIPGCDHCKERQCGSQKFGMESIRPAVRQIIHGGKVFQIQRGSVTETDFQSFEGEQRIVPKDLFSTSYEDQAMKRSKRIERRKRAHSPDDVLHRNMDVTQGSVGLQDINKYISQTLRDIKKQRDGNSTSKWTVKQKKSNKNGLPYSFKKANSKL